MEPFCRCTLRYLAFIIIIIVAVTSLEKDTTLCTLLWLDRRPQNLKDLPGLFTAAKLFSKQSIHVIMDIYMEVWL